MSRNILILVAAASTLAPAAAHALSPEIGKLPALPDIVATPASEPPRPVTIFAIPEPLPLPGQLKPVETARPYYPSDPRTRVIAANQAARIEPMRSGFLNAIQQYPWSEGALYQVYAAPGEVTDIALQEGEQLVGTGPVAAGDTVRWIIGDTISGTGPTARVHILLKPTRSELATNLVINTDRRTYHVELRAGVSTYMASVSWTYPQDQLVAIKAANQAAAAAAPVAAGIDLTALNFHYRIDGDSVPWRPLRAFDDGRQVFIEFPEGIAQSEMPPLFVTGAHGGAELVNYRVQGRYMVVDNLFAAAELRLGDRKSERRVQILRDDGKSRR